jgi:cytochrome b6-f complex iron-sulfur subunit/menaquinol-cytochrome c reductase iron-sulfur subunit
MADQPSGTDSTDPLVQQPAAPASTPVDEARRAVLAKAALGCAAGAAGLATWPLVGALAAPDFSEGQPADSPFLDVAAEKDVPEQQPLRASLRVVARDGWASSLHDVGAVWILRTPAGLVALSASCPHLGCAVEQDSKGFFCPCHESRFDGLGNRRTGPSPRGLDRLPLRVEQGRVLVRVDRPSRRGGGR